MFIDEPVIFDESIAILTGTGVITYELPALDYSASQTRLTGYRRIAVETHNSSHVSDGHRNQLRIGYNNGKLNMTPNEPTFELSSKDGLTVTFNYMINDHLQETVPDKFEIWAEYEDKNQEAFKAGELLTPVIGTGLSYGSIVATVPSEGWYRFIVYAVSSTFTYSKNTLFSDPVFLTAAIPVEPGNVSARIRA